MRSNYHLPWLGEGEMPTDQDNMCMRNIEYLARDVAMHSRCTKAEVKESIYRLIGHECNTIHREDR